MAMAEEKAAKKGGMEGKNLLGPPSFTELENGRFRCVETGHEVVAKDKESYSQSKRCRLGLIDFALANKKPPLNMFKQDPVSRSKLVCKLTGDTVNKSEEHIWKHINGKQFLKKLEEKETGKLGTEVEKVEKKLQGESNSSVNGAKKKKKKQKQKKEKGTQKIISEAWNSSDKESEMEELDFWMPPVGDRWDFDDGGDRWGSDESEVDGEEENGADDTTEENGKESEELSKKTKRMSIEIGPSSFASRKKRSKKNLES